MKAFALKLKGMSSIGSVSLDPIPRVPFVVGVFVMIQLVPVEACCFVWFSYGGHEDILSYKPRFSQ